MSKASRLALLSQGCPDCGPPEKTVVSFMASIVNELFDPLLALQKYPFPFHNGSVSERQLVCCSNEKDESWMDGGMPEACPRCV